MSPHPPTRHLAASHLTFDPKSMDVPAVYRLLIGSVVPRPIAWVSTISPEGILNLAPFSFYTGASSNPPAIVFSITRKRVTDATGSTKKDTLRNIEATGEFVVNASTVSLAQAINQTAAEYDYQVDEFQKAGVHPVASLQIKPPRVLESPVQMECKLLQTVAIGGADRDLAGTSTLVIGEIVQFHVDPSVYQDGQIQLDSLDPLSRLGGLSYGKTREVFDLPRPSAT